MDNRSIKYVVKIEMDGLRLDRLLRDVWGMSGRELRGLIRKQELTVNGRAISRACPVHQGDEICCFQRKKVQELQPELVSIEAEKAQGVRVVYEDEDILGVYKPRGLHSVRNTNLDSLSLADWLAAYCPQTASASPDCRESGLVQRLDFFTSGLIIAGKNRESWLNLRMQLQKEMMKKSYLAVVEGARSRELEPETIVENELIIAPGSKVVKVAEKKSQNKYSQKCQSKIRFIFSHHDENSLNSWSLVLVSGTSMKRHQVRVHSSAIDHPLVGDQLYGAKAQLTEVFSHGAIAEPKAGFLLQALNIHLVHPRSERELYIEAWPTDVERAISSLDDGQVALAEMRKYCNAR